MTLSSISIERPVLASVMSIVILLFGIIGYSYLGVREFPSVDPPIVTVTTNYPGANADIIESQITEPLEESVNGIGGIRSLSSVSSDGRSTITVEFNVGMDMEAAANDVRERVSRSVRQLPPDSEPPIVSKADADQTTILALTVQSDRRDLLQLTQIAENIFKERLQTIDGISDIRIWGQKRYSMRLEMDPLKLVAYGLTPLDVRRTLEQENVELPTGRIEGSNTELTIRAFGRLTTPEDFNNLILKEDEGGVVRFREIGHASLQAENMRTLLRGNNKIPMVGIAVNPQPGSNFISIADEFYERVDQIAKEMPDDIQLGYAFDTTTSVRQAISEVRNTVTIAFLLVVMVIFFFLRDWRTTIIPVIAIPISLLGAFFIMFVAGFSINILTLLAIVLATGLVVDDAIVVLENIYQKIEDGMSPRQAAHTGSKEIFFAIIATTVVLVAVFLPVIFLDGLTGRLFREFGVVVAGAVIISTFVSLTLTPMLSSRLLKQREQQNWLHRNTEKFFVGLTNGYHKALISFMKVKWLAWVFTLICFGVAYQLFNILPSELAPMEDKGRFRVFMTAPEGTSFDLMDQYVLEVLDFVDTIPEKESIIAVTSPGFGASVSVNTAFVRLSFSDVSERERSQFEIADEVNRKLRGMNFARAFVIQDQTISAGRSFRGLPVEYIIQAPTIDRLREVIPEFMERAQAHPGFQVVDLDLKFNKPELAVEIDRDRARAIGVSVMDVAQTMQLFFGGQRFGYFIMDGKQYQVIGEAFRGFRNAPLDLSTVNVRNNRGELIPLDNIVTLSERSSPPQLYRYNRFISATISALPSDGITIGRGIEIMDEIAAEVLDESFSTALTGTSKDFQESSGGLYFAFILALILVYLALAAQFESFVDPLIIMFTVPLALTGALLSLWFFGFSLNIFSQIGIIVLIGIVTKNGILIVEFANQKRRQGMEKLEATLEAAGQRMRPIIMTSLATSLGTLPIALALGSAATSRIPMGVVIIGGLMFALLLTLFVIPAIYMFLSTPKKVEPDVLD
jgi:hydrophobe/amphiphile efflux-1 (HAE1) family protein